MRALIPLLLVCASICSAQQSYNTYGKTEADILKMTASDWQQFYTSKAGDNTVTECDANTIYGVAMEHRNEALIKRSGNSAIARKVARLRSEMADYANHCIDLAMNEAGGGTIWNTFYSGVSSGVEDVIYGILGGSAEVPKHAVVSDVDRSMAHVDATLAKEHADKDAVDYLKYGDAQKSEAQIKAGARQLIELAKGLSRAQFDAVLGFCKSYADIPAKGLAG